MNETAKVVIEWENKKIIIEGPSDFVAQETERFRLHSSKHSLQVSNKLDYQDPQRPESAKDLITTKQPKGHHEAVAVLAFHLTQLGQEEFTEDEIRRAYIQAGVRPPKVVSQALRDAKNKFDYIEFGKKRGTYRLSHHGDRTVRFDLPRL